MRKKIPFYVTENYLKYNVAEKPGVPRDIKDFVKELSEYDLHEILLEVSYNARAYIRDIEYAQEFIPKGKKVNKDDLLKEARAYANQLRNDFADTIAIDPDMDAVSELMIMDDIINHKSDLIAIDEDVYRKWDYYEIKKAVGDAKLYYVGDLIVEVL